MTNPTCCKKVHSYRSPARLCGKPGKFEREGKWYCGIHNPKRAEDQHAAYSVEIHRATAMQNARHAVINAANAWRSAKSGRQITNTEGTLMDAVDFLAALEKAP